MTNIDKSESKIGVIISLIMLLVLFLLSGCITLFDQPSQETILNNRSGYYNCSYVAEEIKPDNSRIEGSYNCYSAVPQSFFTENKCSYVVGYYKTNGEYVSSHQRCATIRISGISGSSSYNGSSQSYAPCVSSYCGPVRVKGYTRKDGTYVRPYTRSRPR